MMRELKEAAKISRCIVRFGVSPDEWQIDADSVCFWLDQRAVRIVGARVCDQLFRHENVEGFFPVSPRGTSGERAGERGSVRKNVLLSPALSSFLWRRGRREPLMRFKLPSLRQTGHVVSFHTAAARRAARLGLPAPSAFIHPRSSAKEDGSESICGSFFLSSRPAVCRLVATDGRGRR